MAQKRAVSMPTRLEWLTRPKQYATGIVMRPKMTDGNFTDRSPLPKNFIQTLRQERRNFIRVQLFCAVDVREILIRHQRERNGGDVQLGALDQVEQQVERSLIHGCLDGVIQLSSEQVFHRVIISETSQGVKSCDVCGTV